MQYSGSSGVVFQSEEQMYAYPSELQERLSRSIASRDERSIESMLDTHSNVKIVSLQGGKLIFLDPLISPDENTLQILTNDLQEDIELVSIFDKILQANMAISANLNLNTLLHIVLSLLEELLNPEVTSVLLLDSEKKNLYWEISRGEKSDFFNPDVKLPIGEGIGGYVAQTGEPVLSNDVTRDPRWASSYDKASGFRTRSLICAPLKSHGEILGVIEVINKKDEEFSLRDMTILEIIASQTGSAIDNARTHGKLEEAYEELKVLDMAKERIINHLSHELKTPLAIISSAIEIITRRIDQVNMEKVEKSVERVKRNVSRLSDIQNEIRDILNERSFEEKEKIVGIVEDTASIIDELGETNDENIAEVIKLVSRRLDSIIEVKEYRKERIRLNEFLDDICDEAISYMHGRELQIQRSFKEDIVLNTDRDILKKVVVGILRNAIENTPDEGEIEIKTKLGGDGIGIDIRDYGTGISPENQKMIFGGFFHTQETGSYSTKRPYEFDAGGVGCDLLRIKILSERCGFDVDYESTVCEFRSKDTDRCPGKISDCQFIASKLECISSGGSTFSITFPNYF
jgi:K+-sensing histidine kinase KdpD